MTAHVTAADLLAQRWYVVLDTAIGGGWAIANVDKPTADLDLDAGHRRIANALAEGTARHVVALHNERLWRDTDGTRAENEMLRSLIRRLATDHVISVQIDQHIADPTGINLTYLTTDEAVLVEQITTEESTT